MTDTPAGFYAVKMSGAEGQGYALIVFKDGIITGVDPLGVRFDGHYSPSEGGSYLAHVQVKVPSNGTVIQGVTTGQAGMTYDVSISLPPDFLDKEFFRIETPLGAVNAKFELLRRFS